MKTILITLGATLADLLRSRASLQLEILALRQQLAMVADGDRKRLSFDKSGRIFWVWLYRLWPARLQTLKIFKPDTLVRWHRKGECLDNAVAESFFGTLKNELVYHEDYKTRAQARQSIFEYIEVFYNRKRRQAFLNYMSPVEYEDRYASN